MLVAKALSGKAKAKGKKQSTDEEI